MNIPSFKEYFKMIKTIENSLDASSTLEEFFDDIKSNGLNLYELMTCDIADITSLLYNISKRSPEIKRCPNNKEAIDFKEKYKNDFESRYKEEWEHIMNSLLWHLYQDEEVTKLDNEFVIF